MAPSPGESSEVGGLQREFAAFATTTAARAPLYAALSTRIAGSPDVAALLAAAPPLQRLPVLVFAAVHRVLFDHPDHALAAWYPSVYESPRSPDRHLWPTFCRFLAEHDGEVRRLLASRTTQTNEVGRCGLLLPAFELIAGDVAAPLGHLDVGTSAGLTLLTDRYGYRYTGTTGTAEINVDSPVVLDIAVRGEMPLPRSLPAITDRLGIDRDPLDVTSHDDARWLEACVWPDQSDRLERLRRAVDLFRDSALGPDPPRVVRGDAVDALGDGVDAVGRNAHPVVTNTWVLNYLDDDRRTRYVERLDEIGTERDLSWVYAEAPALVPGLPLAPGPGDPHLTVLSLVRWRGGHRRVDHLATCHPHGYWIHWH